MVKASKPKPRSNQRTRRAKVAAAIAPSFDVASIMKIAGIDARHKKSIEEFFEETLAVYRHQLGLLKWHASDKQIEEGLAQVGKHADRLITTTQNVAIRDALQAVFVLSSDLPSTDKPEVEAFLKERFDADFDAIGRIHDLARKALKQHDRNSKESPDAGKLASASKPELQCVAARIVSFWKREFDRGGCGRVAPNLHKFALQVFEQITGVVRDENTIRVLIRKASR